MEDRGASENRSKPIRRIRAEGAERARRWRDVSDISDLLVALEQFRAKLVVHLPVQETSIARRGPRGPHPLRGYPAYVSGYVAGSAPGAGNATRRS